MTLRLVLGYGAADALQDKSYHYTKAGDIDQIIDNKKSITYTYTYDALHRLKTETGGPEAISYTYNAVGSLLTRTIGTKTFNYSYNNSAHIHAVSNVTYNGNNYAFTYDANANLTSGPDLSNLDQVVTRSITYDVDNMPTQIVRGSTAVTFTYDGIGTRIKKAVSGGSTTLYIGTHYEVKDGVITKYIFGGNLRLAVIKGSLTYYYHKDHLGSTGAITDSSGAKVESTEYQPFGIMREHTGSNVSDYKFTDQELDNETNLYNYDARLYDPVLGMFVTPDSIIPNQYDPQSLNRYAYCRNNPLIYTDPTGHYDTEGPNGDRVKDDSGTENGGGGRPMPSDGPAYPGEEDGKPFTPARTSISGPPMPGDPGYHSPEGSTTPSTSDEDNTSDYTPPDVNIFDSNTPPYEYPTRTWGEILWEGKLWADLTVIGASIISKSPVTAAAAGVDFAFTANKPPDSYKNRVENFKWK